MCENGWNVTGDTYRRDGDGYYWYLARNDDMIVSSGYNIGAPEVENALLSHAAVAECAVIGVPCPERGQKVKAFVVLAADATGSDDLVAELQAHAKAQIAPYKYPREIEFVDALPKTATGKLRRSELRVANGPRKLPSDAIERRASSRSSDACHQCRIRRAVVWHFIISLSRKAGLPSETIILIGELAMLQRIERVA